MFNRIRERFGTAGLVVSIMALVLALAGGAFAASGGLNAKQKKQVKAIAKTFQGTGPAGAPGLAGLAGAKGDTGAAGGQGIQGIQGIPGPNGKAVLNGAGAPTVGIGALGDFYIDTSTQEIYGPKAASGINGGWGSPTPLKGAQGNPWTAGGTLPTSATETGTFVVQVQSNSNLGNTAGYFIGSISFPIPLGAPLDAAHAILVPVGNTTTAHCSAASPNGPGGTATTPKADSGYLCVYEKNKIGTMAGGGITGLGLAGGSQTTGTAVGYQPGATGGYVDGSWAVTG